MPASLPQKVVAGTCLRGGGGGGVSPLTNASSSECSWDTSEGVSPLASESS